MTIKYIYDQSAPWATIDDQLWRMRAVEECE